MSTAVPVILIVGSCSEGFVEMVERALKLAGGDANYAVIAPCLDRRHCVTVPNMKQIRDLEREVIRRRFADEVYFTHPLAADVAELVALAKQYGYGEDGLRQTRSAA